MQHVNQTTAIATDLGLDARGIPLRKSFLEFGTTDVDHLRAIHDQLESQRADFAAAFYDYFLSFDELATGLPQHDVEIAFYSEGGTNREQSRKNCVTS